MYFQPLWADRSQRYFKLPYHTLDFCPDQPGKNLRIAKVLLSNLYILDAANEYDLFLAGNSLTESRAKIVDHSFPIILTSVRMIYLRHSESASDSSTWVYTQSFLVISWIVIASMTLLTFVIYFFLQRLANKVHMMFFSY